MPKDLVIFLGLLGLSSIKPSDVSDPNSMALTPIQTIITCAIGIFTCVSGFAFEHLNELAIMIGIFWSTIAGINQYRTHTSARKLNELKAKKLEIEIKQSSQPQEYEDHT